MKQKKRKPPMMARLAVWLLDKNHKRMTANEEIALANCLRADAMAKLGRRKCKT